MYLDGRSSVLALHPYPCSTGFRRLCRSHFDRELESRDCLLISLLDQVVSKSHCTQMSKLKTPKSAILRILNANSTTSALFQETLLPKHRLRHNVYRRSPQNVEERKLTFPEADPPATPITNGLLDLVSSSIFTTCKDFCEKRASNTAKQKHFCRTPTARGLRGSTQVFLGTVILAGGKSIVIIYAGFSMSKIA